MTVGGIAIDLIRHYPDDSSEIIGSYFKRDEALRNLNEACNEDADAYLNGWDVEIFWYSLEPIEFGECC